MKRLGVTSSTSVGFGWELGDQHRGFMGGFARGRVTRRRVMYMNGYDAWLCFFRGVGEGFDSRNQKPTSYKFVARLYVRDGEITSGSIRVTHGDQDYVRERTMEHHKRDALDVLDRANVKLGWLSEEDYQTIRQKVEPKCPICEAEQKAAEEGGA